jgi:hypothetical protein
MATGGYDSVFWAAFAFVGFLAAFLLPGMPPNHLT